MRRRVQALALLALVGSLAVGVTGASGAEIQQYQSSFVGTGSSQGSFSPGGLNQIAIDRAAGSLYVTDGEKQVIDKFDLFGNPVDFSALGTTTLAGGGMLSVDNTGTGSQGHLFHTSGGQIHGFKPDGTPISPNFPITYLLEGVAFCAMTVTPSGNLWGFAPEPEFFPSEEFTPDGTRTGAKPPFQLCSGSSAFDQAGNFYVAGQKLDASNGYAPVEPSPFIVGQSYTGPMAMNPVNQDVYFALREDFVTRADRIVAFHTSDDAPSEPFEVLTGFHDVRGMAFDADGDLYVSEAGEFGVPNSAKVDIFHRGPSGTPVAKRAGAINVRTTLAEFGAGEVRANGSDASLQVEYGTDSSYGSTTPTVDLGSSVFPYKNVRTPRVEGLAPGTTYHYRLAFTNAEGTSYTPDRVFTTFPMPAGGTDSCPNALARKQTGALELPDCRAYELVSARDSGGYDVESSLVAGQSPQPGYPNAKGRVLYATHSGAVPGPWHATNKGPDPYLATRGPSGWSTSYLGLPSDINPASGPFSSVLGEANANLDTLAFAGEGLCSPCFSAGIETGIPVRLPSGQLVQGMAGSLDPGVATAMPEGRIAKYFSADGKHLVFASKYAFEPGANNNSGDLTVYDRDLSTGETRIVSTTTGGSVLTGAGISELDISADGSRILFGQKVSADSAGNEYVHPYLHLAGSPNSVDLAPTTTSGVLYDGMSADGSKVFFTSKDALLPGDDTDTSADIYAAEVDSEGNVTLSLISAGNSTSCNPVSNSAHSHWNSVSGTADCGAVAIGGGGGVASASGEVYFLSPEQLDGSEGTENQPNLYRASPGEAPTFIATLEPGNPLVLDSVGQAAKRQTGDFQTTPSGNDAVFTSKLGLTENDPTGDAQVFHYAAAGEGLECSSCSPTNGLSPGAAGDATLAPEGSSLSDDGRVFFTTPVPLVLSDTGNRKDVYESSGGPAQLISTGISPFDSGLLSVSADGTDAYFFTHDDLAPAEDREGTLTRIYDARENGGFFAIPGPAACAAADECHGPGTQSAPAPTIRTGGPSTVPGNQQAKPPTSCRKGQAKKRGRCVAKKRHSKKHHTTKKSQSKGSHKHA